MIFSILTQERTLRFYEMEYGFSRIENGPEIPILWKGRLKKGFHIIAAEKDGKFFLVSNGNYDGLRVVEAQPTTSGLLFRRHGHLTVAIGGQVLDLQSCGMYCPEGKRPERFKMGDAVRIRTPQGGNVAGTWNVVHDEGRGYMVQESATAVVRFVGYGMVEKV